MTALMNRLWDRAARHPLLALLLVAAAQTVFVLGSRSLWYSDEVRYANAYENLLHGHWLVLSLNGVPYPDKPPVYFWFLALVDKLTPGSGEQFFFIGAALSGVLFVWAAYALARALGWSREQGLAGGLVLLCTLFFSAILHYSRMDLLFAALIVASHACLYKDAVSHEAGDRPTWWPVAGLALAGLAVLVKGPLGIIFPLLTYAAFLVWRGRARQLVSRSVLLGLLAALAVMAAWILAAWAVEGGTFLRQVFVEQIFERATNTFHHKEGPFWYLVVLPLTWLPWTFYLAAVPVGRLFSGAFWRGLRAGRKTADPARTWLWVWWLSSFVLLSLLSGKVVIYVLPLFAPLALLTADHFLTLDGRGRSRVGLALGGFLAVLGGLILFAEDLAHFAMDLDYLWIPGSVFLAGGLGLALWRKASAKAWLTALTLLVTLWINGFCGFVAPSLDPYLSPRAQAEKMGEYIRQGYLPVAYDIYPGIYTYYAGSDIVEIPEDVSRVAALMADNPKVVAAFKKKHYVEWGENGGRPDGLRIVDEQWIVDQPYVLVLSEHGPGNQGKE